MGDRAPTLRVALLAASASDRPAANRDVVRTALAAARDAGAHLVATPECFLTGYPSAARADLTGIDWCAVAEAEDELLNTAERLGLVLALGSCSPPTDGAAPTNTVVIGGAGLAPLRYAKRVLTPTDAGHFRAGAEQPVLFNVAGWRVGVSICFEVRFGDLWQEQAAGGADLFLSVSHMAGPDPDPGTKARIIPALYATRAAEWATPLALANTADADRYLDSAVWDARGERIATQAAGLLIHDIAHRDAAAPWYAALRARHLARWGRAG